MIVFPGIMRSRRVQAREGLAADFINGVFTVRPVGGNTTTFSDAQSMFTWSSATKWTRQASGTWTASGTNTPAYEWDETGVALGISIEGQRTNSCLRSDDMTNASWTKTSITAAKNATGPDGTANSASTLTATGANGTCLQSFTSTSQTRCYSVFVRRKTGSGSIEMTVDNGTAWTAINPTMFWARFTLVQAAVTNPVIGLRIVTSGDEIEVMWNQLENAVNFASSPIPTAGVTATRTADVLTRSTGSEFSATAGTMIVGLDVVSTATEATNRVISTIWDGTSNNRFQFYITISGTDIDFRVTNGGASQADIDGPAWTANVPYYAAAAWSANDIQLVVNGTSQGTDATASMPTVTTYLLGNIAGNTTLFGHIRRFDLYPERLTQAQMETLTAG